MLSMFSQQLGGELAPRSIPTGSSRLELDGVSDDDHVLCDAFAHLGALKAGQLHKVTEDLARLLLAERILAGSWRKVLLFADDDARESFHKGWRRDLADRFGVECIAVTLPEQMTASVRAAQRRQFR